MQTCVQGTGCGTQIAGEVARGGEAADVPDEGDERGGGDQADAGDRAQPAGDGDLASEGPELLLHRAHAPFELEDLGPGLVEGGPNGIGEAGVGVFEELLHDRDDALGPERDGDAEFPEQTADGVDPRRPGGEPGRAQPMQGGERLLVDGLDRHGLDLLVPLGLEQTLGVTAVGLVAGDVGTSSVRREQQDAMAEGLDLSSPVVSRATGLHQDDRRLALGEEAEERVPGEAVSLGHLAGVAMKLTVAFGARSLSAIR